MTSARSWWLLKESNVYRIRRPPYARCMQTFAACLACVAAICAPVWAHHGASVSFDVKRPIVLRATVTRFSWSNPHCELFFDVRDEHGKIAHWISETNAPETLARIGWTRNSLKPGDKIAITVFPSTSGATFGLISKIVVANGEELLPFFPKEIPTEKAASPPQAP